MQHILGYTEADTGSGSRDSALQLERYIMCLKGLGCEVLGQIPEEVSFEELRASGLQPEERELPDEPPQPRLQQQQQGNRSEAASGDAANDEVVSTLESMGFSNNAAK